MSVLLECQQFLKFQTIVLLFYALCVNVQKYEMWKILSAFSSNWVWNSFGKLIMWLFNLFYSDKHGCNSQLIRFSYPLKLTHFSHLVTSDPCLLKASRTHSILVFRIGIYFSSFFNLFNFTVVNSFNFISYFRTEKNPTSVIFICMKFQ